MHGWPTDRMDCIASGGKGVSTGSSLLGIGGYLATHEMITAGILLLRFLCLESVYFSTFAADEIKNTRINANCS